MMTEARRILYVEDHEESQIIMRLLLRQAGYDCTVAGSIAEGLDLAQPQPFDAYIIDFTLPDGDGVDFCRRVREIWPQAKCLYYTAHSLEPSQIRELTSAGEAFVLKPAIFETLQQSLEKLLASNAT